MDHWLLELCSELDQLEARHLKRSLKPVAIEGPLIKYQNHTLINLASNDYLALSQHPHLIHRNIEAVRQFGTGAGASRLVSGHLELHQKFEQRFATFKHAPAALLCPTGYMANLTVLTTLAKVGDLVCLDKLCHASLIDAARASGALVRIFPHLNLDKLDRVLSRKHDMRRRFIVTDSVFSMDGDVADLPRLVELAKEHNAILVVDEAHATGVLGAAGSGLCELQKVVGQVDIVISTASKALGGLGGMITAARPIIDTLVNTSRSFIYTTAVSPGQIASIDAAIDMIEREPQRRLRLATLLEKLKQGLSRMNQTFLTSSHMTPIVPLVVGSVQAALDLSNYLQAAGFFAPAIRPPTVAVGQARVRLTLRADLQDQDIDRLLNALEHWYKQYDFFN